ncbi:hypothetical protein MMC09_003468 [Bachmanniomyces sp. S44760]|nr:hypothetical protein [Bachmanniomyces sp. S44760]
MHSSNILALSALLTSVSAVTTVAPPTTAIPTLPGALEAYATDLARIESDFNTEFSMPEINSVINEAVSELDQIPASVIDEILPSSVLNDILPTTLVNSAVAQLETDPAGLLSELLPALTGLIPDVTDIPSASDIDVLISSLESDLISAFPTVSANATGSGYTTSTPTRKTLTTSTANAPTGPSASATAFTGAAAPIATVAAWGVAAIAGVVGIAAL